jgi:hypothetical protein
LHILQVYDTTFSYSRQFRCYAIHTLYCLPLYGSSAGTYAPAPYERVHTILSWLQQLIIERMADGGIKVSAPLQSNIHAVLADAMMGYEHCKYVTSPPIRMQSS